MNIVVCAKQAVDVSAIKVDPATQRPVLQGVPRKISDFDRNALEEAINIKDGLGGKITVVTVGPESAKENIKELLAMGADEAVLVKGPEDMDHHVTAGLIAAAVKTMENVDLIICGEASIDMFSGQTGPRVAALLGMPQLSYAAAVNATKDAVTVDRDLGDRIETVESPYPALITVTKEINKPRLPSLMQILGAASKPLKVLDPSELGAEKLDPRTETIEIRGVSMKRKNVIFDDDMDQAVGELVENLVKDGVLG